MLDYMRLLRQITSGAAQSRLSGYARARLAELTRFLELREADLLITITRNG